MIDNDIEDQLPEEPFKKAIESEKQMFLRIGKKFAFLAALIIFFDTIVGILSVVFDITLSTLHFFMELIEYGLELLMEHLLNAEHHQSEMIIINFVLLILLVLFYRFSFTLLKYLASKSHSISQAWHRYLHREAITWQFYTLFRKIEIIITYVTGTATLLFLLTL